MYYSLQVRKNSSLSPIGYVLMALVCLGLAVLIGA